MVGRELPSKESASFKSILKLYEHKQFKKGLKLADQILKKFPEHGETLSMKGLIVSQLDRKEEAYDLVKKGLKFDITSHICWHVFGLLHRADKNYDEAIKCYRQALRFDKENIQIIRDLSLLQIQMRNLEGYNESRLLLLKLKPANRAYWIGLAISFHLLKKYDKAIEILDAFDESLREKTVGFEQSELLLYKNMILVEKGEYEAALSHLDEVKKNIVDHLTFMERRAELLVKLGRTAESEKAYRELIEYNPDNLMYYKCLETCLNLSRDNQDDLESIKGIYQKYSEKFSKSYSVERELLLLSKDFAASRNDLKSLMDKMIRKGVPSVFVTLKIFYGDKEKVAVIESVALELRKEYEEVMDEDGDKKPWSKIWSYYFLAQHFDAVRDYSQAISYIDKAIELANNDNVELLIVKARIFKHVGDLKEAAKIMDDARKLDLSDRFINSKSVKYFLRSGQMEQAEKTAILFTKQAEPTDQLYDLVEMQCMWYAIEYGRCALKAGNIGLALKRFHQVEKHFSDIIDDQFDFHTYSLRKNALKAYIEMLKMEDKLYSFPFYVTAASEAIKIYLELHDSPISEGIVEKLKKVKINSWKEDTNKVQHKDEDPLGIEYLGVSNPLGEALKLLKPMLLHSPESCETYLTGFEIYHRKADKPILTLKMVKKALELDPLNPRCYANLLCFYNQFQKLVVALGKDKTDQMNQVKCIVEEQISKLTDGASDRDRDIFDHIQAKISSCPDSVDKVISEIQVLKEKSQTPTLSSIVKSQSFKDCSVNDAIKLLKYVVGKVGDEQLCNELTQTLKAKFPLATCF